MDNRRSIKNISVAMVFKVILLIGSILTKRFLIQYAGNEINGLNSLYLSLVGFLSVAELGVGSAITFCMYKPIVEKDSDKVAALYQLFKKAYRIIGAVVLAVGLLMLPFLPMFAKDYSEVNVNLYTTFTAMLISVVLSFMFSAKTSLINAYKDDYITTTISSGGMVVQQVLQITVLVLTHSFVWYLICRIIAISLQWIVTELVANKMHSDVIKYKKQKLDSQTKSQVIKNVKALFMHKIGTILITSAGNVVISAFIGITMLGKYSNYTTIVLAMTGLIALFFTPLTAIIGHMYVSEKEQIKDYYKFFFTLNFILGTVFFLGYYSVIDNLITILFGEGLELSKNVSFVITVNYFIQFMRQSTLLFRDATGTFYNDRWKPLLEGVLNVFLSIVLVNVLSSHFGEELGLVGIIIATIVTNLAICHVIEPYVLYKHAFNASPRKHLIKNYLFIALFVAALYLQSKLMRTLSGEWTEMLVNAVISIACSSVIVVITVLADKNFKHYCGFVFSKFKKKAKDE